RGSLRELKVLRSWSLLKELRGVRFGCGRPFFQAFPSQIRLRLVEAVPAPGVTHLHHEVRL
ncbi:hypothetical protein ACFQD1_02460, partial [Nonomuraea thailandensis]